MVRPLERLDGWQSMVRELVSILGCVCMSTLVFFFRFEGREDAQGSSVC